MNDALTITSLRYAASLPRYAISRFLHSASQIVLHPIITLPVLIYLLGGAPSQIVWYAIVAGVAFGMAAPAGTLVAFVPATSRIVILLLLIVQVLGFLTTGFLALMADTLSDGTFLRMAAIGYLLLVVPTTILYRISEQGHEYRASVSASLSGVLPAILGSLLAGLIVWRVYDAGGMGPNDLLARVVLAGALFASAAAWLASFPTLIALQFPHPARPMPSIRAPRIVSNGPLLRYAAFQLIRGLTRFADPFLLVGVLTLINPGSVWIGGAVLAFAIGEALARLISIAAFDGLNVRVLFTIGGFLHALAFILIAFAGEIFEASMIADRNPSDGWVNWTIIAAALALGASYRFAITGHQAYIRSISSPQTRDLSLSVVGIILVLTAFSPIIAVRLLDAQDTATLLQIGAGASILSLLSTALIVAPYSAPKRRRSSWGLRGR